MRILILGGTGAMGSHLVTLLSDQGDEVLVTSRRHRESNRLVQYIVGDAKDLNFLNKILKKQWDSIIDFMIYSEDEFRERVDQLLESTSQYVFMSSARVYNNCAGFITEKTRRLLDSTSDQEFLATSEYSLLKARQENILLSSNKKNWTIVRPYITYSENRLQLGNLEKENWLYRALKGRTIVFSEDMMNQYTTLTYGLDVSRGIMKIINCKSSLGESYHITNKESYKWSDVLKIYSDLIEDKTGKRPKVLLQSLDEFLVWNPGKYQIIYDRLFDRRFDNKKIGELIDTNEFVELSRGIYLCLNEFLIDSEFHCIDWKSEAIQDKFTGERTLLREIKGYKQKLKYIIYRYII